MMLSMNPVRAVVFDVGDTLWFQAVSPDPARYFGLQARALAPLVERWGLPLREPLDHVCREIWTAGEEADAAARRQGTLREASLPRLIRSVLAARRVDITSSQAEEWWRAAWILEREFGVQLYPDTLDVLRELRALGLGIGVSTTRPCTSDMFLPGLHDMGIGPYVDAVACSGDTGYAKPHPSTFELVLRKLGVASPEAVMVGDGAIADMRGGKAAGMRTVWKLNGRYDQPPCPDAEYAIHDLGELLTLPLFRRAPRPLVSTESLTPHEDGNEDRY